MGSPLHNVPESSYRFEDAWSLHLYTYHGTLIVNDLSFPIAPNYVSVVPPDTDLTWRLDDSPGHHLHVLFHMPDSNTETVPIPFIQDLDEEFPRYYHALNEAILCFPSDSHRVLMIAYMEPFEDRVNGAT